MLKQLGASSYIGARVKDAVERTLQDYRAGEVSEEDHITSRLVTNIKRNVNETRHGRMIFKGIQTAARGRGSLESKLGADFVGILKVNLPRLDFSKLFLVQVKKAIAGKRGLSLRLDQDLTEQCEKMLAITDDALVMVVSSTRLEVVDARTVHEMGKRDGSTVLNIHNALYSKSFPRYMQDVYATWQGDADTGKEVDTPEDLERIVDDLGVLQGFIIKAQVLSDNLLSRSI